MKSGGETFCRKTSTHLPSGEKALAEPCPSRTAEAPVVSRLNTAYSPPPASPASMKRMTFPSSETSIGTVQCCQLRSRSLLSPGARPIAPALCGELQSTRSRHGEASNFRDDRAEPGGNAGLF